MPGYPINRGAGVTSGQLVPQSKSPVTIDRAGAAEITRTFLMRTVDFPSLLPTALAQGVADPDFPDDLLLSGNLRFVKDGHVPGISTIEGNYRGYFGVPPAPFIPPPRLMGAGARLPIYYYYTNHGTPHGPTPYYLLDNSQETPAFILQTADIPYQSPTRSWEYMVPVELDAPTYFSAPYDPGALPAEMKPRLDESPLIAEPHPDDGGDPASLVVTSWGVRFDLLHALIEFNQEPWGKGFRVTETVALRMVPGNTYALTDL